MTKIPNLIMFGYCRIDDCLPIGRQGIYLVIGNSSI